MIETLLNKKVSLERCIQQVRAYYGLDTGLPFTEDYLKQDAIAMNLQRACELTIDMANTLIKHKQLGLPQSSRESFTLLQQAGLITVEQMQSLQAMVGFPNTLVHEYQALSLDVVVDVIEHRLDDLLDFANMALAAAS